MPYRRGECSCPDCNPDPGGVCSQTPYCQLVGTDEEGTECPDCEYWIPNVDYEIEGVLDAKQKQ